MTGISRCLLCVLKVLVVCIGSLIYIFEIVLFSLLQLKVVDYLQCSQETFKSVIWKVLLCFLKLFEKEKKIPSSTLGFVLNIPLFKFVHIM